MHGQPLVAVDEHSPLALGSRAPYSATKAAAEAAVIEANGAGLETVVVRPRFVWGAGDTTLLPILVDMARSGPAALDRRGRQLTSTTHVDNTVEGLVLAAERGPRATPALRHRRLAGRLPRVRLRAARHPGRPGARGRAAAVGRASRRAGLGDRVAPAPAPGEPPVASFAVWASGSRPRSTTPRRASSSATRP